MSKNQIREAAIRAKLLAEQGLTKNQIYAEITPSLKKPLYAARIVVALPNPEGVRRYKRSTVVLGTLMFVLALMIGLAKIMQVIDVAQTTMTGAGLYAVAAGIGFVFFLVFALLARSILKHQYGAYVGTVFLLLLLILQSLRSTLNGLADPSAGALILLELVIGVLLPIIMIVMTVKVRNNVFSKVKFFGAPRKNNSGGYEFASAFEKEGA